ncbi:hypothetical protein CspeluHIS016_0205410 [Cutaneotrichosporon spelunceum]|uniref:Glycoside hydrolase family 5 domain-containing protein n=1 Tax=Cutaneotrichosporon spelunceum TaxID=1672016 RepID=A0AAD3TRG1_9TREE|nr:hypothetical protein CspeluHIS016_0205410 [Cutaneotrichosporon spelunceum]
MTLLAVARTTLIALLASGVAAMPTMKGDVPRPEQVEAPGTPSPFANTSNVDGPVGMNRIAMNWPYGQQKIRGVNLGGWLVLESWITPTLFDQTGNKNIIDEWTFGQLQDRAKAAAALKRHWDSWITEDDFRQIAAAGLNHVRLPIGYWAYDTSAGEPYHQGQAPYVDRAVDWARKHGLRVLIELHSAPGSQNGFDNSGRYGAPHFQDDPQNAVRLKKVVNILAKKYANDQTVTALGLLNEPATFYGQNILDYTTQFWRDGYDTARWPWAEEGNGAQSNLLIVISDGFQPLSHWNNFMSEPQYTSVAIDTHYYQIFSNDELRWTWPERLQKVCSKRAPYSASPNRLMVGEWSVASTDCAKYLNTRNKGHRYDGTFAGSTRIGSCADKTGDGNNFSSQYKDFMRQFFDTQVQVYENHGQGWFYWTWKNENAADWSYKRGMELGFIPRNPTSYKYPLANTCR